MRQSCWLADPHASSVHRWVFECLRVVAAIAASPEAAAMYVISLMATGAVSRHADLTADYGPVAFFAEQLLMSAVEPEVGLPIMVELPEIPAVRVVAQPALRAEAALVSVIGLMTASADHGGALEAGR